MGRGIAAVVNFGCKVNKYECDGIMTGLAEAGFEVVDGLGFADVYVINTCAVTQEAEKKSRQGVARCRRFNPKAKIYVIGCASQNDKNAFITKDNVVYAAGTAGKADVINKITEDCAGADILPEIPKEYEMTPFPYAARTRGYVKIQDGCDNFCGYCLIPYVRGRSRSRDIAGIAEECAKLSQKVKEIVLTGINISDFKPGLTALIKALAQIPVRIRLGSLEAPVIDEGLLDALKRLKDFCPHFHLSLQSGDDGVLASMNRHYKTDDFFRQVQIIRRVFPDAAITTDLICGFPSETEEQFKQSLDFAEAVGFADMHVFGYSRRKGTRADREFGSFLPKAMIAERVKRAEALRDRMKSEFAAGFIGRPLEVLIEYCEEGYSAGYSGSYIRVYTKDPVPTDEIVTIIPKRLYKDGLEGDLKQ